MRKLALFRWSALASLLTAVGAAIACGSSGGGGGTTTEDAGQGHDATVSHDSGHRGDTGSLSQGDGSRDGGRDDGTVMSADSACATKNVAASLSFLRTSCSSWTAPTA